MARGDSINSLLQMQAYRRAEMEGQIAKRDVYGETKNFVEMWRKNNGLEGTKALPPRNEVPFQWMLPFLDKVETQDTKPSPVANQSMMIAETAADMSRPTTGGYFLDDKGGAFINTPDGLIYDGEYNPDIHGLPVPLAKGNNSMMIATDPSKISQPTEKGYFLDDEEGIYGHVYQNEDGYLKEGKMYDQGIHGLPVPLV
tara:strand:+ start:37 stop:633 length:597 start_codon:yes stop_codon:yes gene_type:complete